MPACSNSLTAYSSIDPYGAIRVDRHDDDGVVASSLSSARMRRSSSAALVGVDDVREVVDRLRSASAATVRRRRRAGDQQQRPATSATRSDPHVIARQASMNAHRRSDAARYSGKPAASARARVGRAFEREHGAHEIVGQAGQPCRERARASASSAARAVQTRDVAQQRAQRRGAIARSDRPGRGHGRALRSSPAADE